MTSILIFAAILIGGAWRRWLGADKATGPRSTKVAIGFALAYAVVVVARWEWSPLDLAYAAACSGAVVLPLVMAMDWHKLKWTAWRWAGSGLPLAGLLGIGQHYVAAGLAPVACAAAGLSWAATFRAPWAWPELGTGHWLRGYTAYAEVLSGAIVFGFAAAAF